MASLVPRIEEIVLEKGSIGLGFNIRGGTDNIHVGSDPGIFVTTVKPNGAAAKDGRLLAGDKILEMNGNDLREVTHQKAVDYFHGTGEVVTLLVERGAEQRIRDQLAASTSEIQLLEGLNDEAYGAMPVAAVPPQHSPTTHVRSVWWWSLVPLAVIGVGSMVLIWYIRRRR